LADRNLGQAVLAVVDLGDVVVFHATTKTQAAWNC
jgi:hypothetical protein